MIGGKALTMAGKAGCLVHCATTPGVEAAGLAKGFPEVAFSCLLLPVWAVLVIWIKKQYEQHQRSETEAVERVASRLRWQSSKAISCLTAGEAAEQFKSSQGRNMQWQEQRGSRTEEED